MTRALFVALVLLLGTPAVAEDYEALFDEAAAAIEWNFEEEWAFTESRVSDDKVWVSRFDPRKPDDELWTLLTVDGRTPTEDELDKFRRSKEDYSPSANDQRMDIVLTDTLELIEESDDGWRFRFVPDEDEVEFVENVDSTLTIVKDGPWVETIDLRNHSDIKPGFGTKIGTFNFRMEFGPATPDGPIVPKLLKIRVSGRAVLIIGFDETELIEYSDFEFVR